jgi:hypothetical protein
MDHSCLFHHSMAAALVGWVLIFPPLVGDRVDIGAPVNEWEVMGKGFATVRECEEFRAHVQGYANLTEVLNDPKKAAQVKAFPERRANSRCTPDDDPRLNSK